MKIIHPFNKESRQSLRLKIQQENTPRTTLSFYRYFAVADPEAFRVELYLAFDNLDILGRIYVAHEGINAQLSVPEHNLEHFTNLLNQTPGLENLRLNLAVEEDPRSFFALRIKVRKKIVADGLDDSTFNPADGGQHLDAATFNEIVSQPNTVVVDMRNHYESEIGHFEGAVLPDVDTFRDSLPIVENILEPHRDKNIVMYCTGGIRCEKASAWFKHRGFKHVFQLEGGIINYARVAKEKGLKNKFLGKNFVFDERLGERIGHEIISQCHQCGAAADTHTNCLNEACHLLFIQCERCKETFSGCCSEACAEVASLPAEVQKELRKGNNPGRMVFAKGRVEGRVQTITYKD